MLQEIVDPLKFVIIDTKYLIIAFATLGAAISVMWVTLIRKIRDSIEDCRKGEEKCQDDLRKTRKELFNTQFDLRETRQELNKLYSFVFTKMNDLRLSEVEQINRRSKERRRKSGDYVGYNRRRENDRRR